MRYHEIITELFDPTPYLEPKLLTQAEADGFDTSTIWFHGTTKKFTKFRLPKKAGIDELGRGVYVTSIRGRANIWAKGEGQVLACVLRKGPLIELSHLTRSKWDRPEVWDEVYRGYDLMMTRDFGPGSTIDYREFAERVEKGKIKLADCYSALGYIGATNMYSQIKGQAVIWNVEDVKIVGRIPGIDDWVPDDE